MRNKKFDIASYEYLIKIIKNSMRKIIFFNQYFSGKTGIILRHDVDFSPAMAFKIAKIESHKSVFSTFFVMLNSKLYNMQQSKNVKIIKSIISLGHEVGLHFDPSLYEKEKFSLDFYCKSECETLEDLIDKKIDIISFHRPAKKFIGMKKKIAGRYHSYMPGLILNSKYCSDSEGEWRFDDPEELINNKTIKNIQLLTHPIWWVGEGNTGPQSKLDSFLYERSIKLKFELSTHCSAYQLTDLKE